MTLIAQSLDLIYNLGFCEWIWQVSHWRCSQSLLAVGFNFQLSASILSNSQGSNAQVILKHNLGHIYPPLA